VGLRRIWLADAGVAMPYVLVFLFFPVVYYLTHPEDYYRRPIDPQYELLAAFAVVSWVAERNRRLAGLPPQVAVATAE
jgi:hypothetical protein